MKKNFSLRPKWPLFLLFLVFLTAAVAQKNDTPRRFKLPQVLNEVSGLAVAGPDSLWWHNDSGHEASLFLTNRAGELLSEVSLPVQNYDWEDLSKDTDGRLYLGDFGDNRRARDEAVIYCYDPHTGTVDSTTFNYAGQLHHDTEAFFWYQDTFHLFTKQRISRARLMTYHYVMPAKPGHQTAELRDSLSLRKRVVTAAAIHPETGTVVLLAYYYTKRLGFIPYSAANIYFFNDYPEGHFLQGRRHSRRISFIVATQYESVDFLDAKHLLVASEQTLFIKAKAKRKRTRPRN